MDDPASLKAAGPANGSSTNAYAVHSRTIQTLNRVRRVIGPCQAKIASRRVFRRIREVARMKAASTAASLHREMFESMPRGTTRVPTTLPSVTISSATPTTNPSHCMSAVTPPSWPSHQPNPALCSVREGISVVAHLATASYTHPDVPQTRGGQVVPPAPLAVRLQVARVRESLEVAARRLLGDVAA